LASDTSPKDQAPQSAVQDRLPAGCRQLETAHLLRRFRLRRLRQPSFGSATRRFR
jgi:hypothetical protein